MSSIDPPATVPPPPPPPAPARPPGPTAHPLAGGGMASGPPVSTHGAPRVRPVLAAEYRLILRSVATRGRLAAVAALAAIALMVALIDHSQFPYHTLDRGTGYASNMLIYILPVSVLVFASATLGDLIDDGSLVYLWLRPVPPWVHVVAAWLATITIATPLILAPIVLSTAIIDASTSLLVGVIGAGLLAVVAYAALFVMAGVRFRRALPWGLVYIMIWEGFIAGAGKGAAKLALRSYVASVISRETDIYIKLANFTLASAIIVPLVASAAFLAYGARRLGRSDVA